MRLRGPDSLAFRVVALSSLWAIAAFSVIGGLISTLYDQTASRGFEELLVAQLYNLVNTVSVTPEGVLSGTPDLGDLRYAQPLSGWYWEVLPAAPNTKGRLASASLGGASIVSPDAKVAPFDLYYRRNYETKGLDGEDLKVVETEIVLDQENHVARFRVMGNASLLNADVTQFNWRLGLYLGCFGLGSILINAFAILYGLRPLVAVRRALGEVRAGREERLRGDFPAELRPLMQEMNGLIDNNRRIVERARTQVGNLAHSLKTPIAVLTNEATALGGETGRLVAEQTAGMRFQVQHYLDRARVAAQSEGVVFRAAVTPALERLARVMVKLNPEIRFEGPLLGGPPLVFAGEAQDYEEIVGNLLENAAKWTKTRIRLSARAEGGDSFRTTVEDDGPGLGDEEIVEALKRGRRLDENKPGSGLGLSIVAQTVREYRGTLTLSQSDLGGLRADIVLPLALGSEIP